MPISVSTDLLVTARDPISIARSLAIVASNDASCSSLARITKSCLFSQRRYLSDRPLPLMTPSLRLTLLTGSVLHFTPIWPLCIRNIGRDGIAAVSSRRAIPGAPQGGVHRYHALGRRCRRRRSPAGFAPSQQMLGSGMELQVVPATMIRPRQPGRRIGTAFGALMVPALIKVIRDSCRPVRYERVLAGHPYRIVHHHYGYFDRIQNCK